MGLSSPSAHELLINSIVFAVPSFLLFLGRILSSTIVMRRVQIDDYLMCIFFLSYVALLALINISSRFSTNLFPPEDYDMIMSDPEEVRRRIIGSKLVIPLEQCMLLTIWGVKVCLLFFLYRMTRQMPKERQVLAALSAYVAVGYAVIMISYYGILCQPFSQYWAMPVQNSECATYSNYSKIQMAFNISSDVFIILMPSTIIYRSGLPMKRKLILIGIFCLGIFTVVCAILNKVYNFSSPETTVYQLWYIREASVAMWVGNVVCCWQLIQWLFHLRSFDDKHAEIQGRAATPTPERSSGGRVKNDTWFRSMMARIPTLQASRGDKMTEMFSPDDAHSIGGTTLEEEKKNKGVENITMMSLQGHDGDQSDASHAIKYRSINDIA